MAERRPHCNVNFRRHNVHVLPDVFLVTLGDCEAVAPAIARSVSRDSGRNSNFGVKDLAMRHGANDSVMTRKRRQNGRLLCEDMIHPSLILTVSRTHIDPTSDHCQYDFFRRRTTRPGPNVPTSPALVTWPSKRMFSLG